MSEPITASEAKQILDAIQAMRSDMQALTLEVRVNQAKTDEQFNTLRAEFKSEINGVQGQVETVQGQIKALNDKVDLKFDAVQIQTKALSDNLIELRSQQRATDGRLWSFIITLILLLTGGLVKLTFFDQP